MSLKTPVMSLAIGLLCGIFPPLVAAGQTTPTSPSFINPSDASTKASETPPSPGAKITTQNWTQYREFMSDGLQALFEGKYAWKMPESAEIDVKPTTIYPPPQTFRDATEKYAAQVKLVELPDGGITLQNYQGGFPFLHPDGPQKGWEILANVWYRYFPHVSYINHGGGCSLDHTLDINCAAGDIVYRQLSFNTDPGVPQTVPGAADKFYTQWYMLTEPEQSRYTASLQITYTDLQRNEDLYAFVPALRRYQPVSTLGRCSMVQGVDITQEDYRSGFDSNLTQLRVDYLGERKVLAQFLSKMPDSGFPGGFDVPPGWLQPAFGSWQLRDVYVISVSKLPSKAKNYCYGKRVMYVDKTTYAPLWEELYDSNMQPWKIVGLYLRVADVPGLGKVETSGSLIYNFWDIRHRHASFVLDPTNNTYSFYLNQQVPSDYLDLERYTTPGGLNMIMR